MAPPWRFLDLPRQLESVVQMAEISNWSIFSVLDENLKIWCHLYLPDVRPTSAGGGTGYFIIFLLVSFCTKLYFLLSTYICI